MPKKAIRTIPELELDAATRAVLLLKKFIGLHTKIQFDEIHLAVDNSSVFNWLVYGVQKPTVHVKNRLKKIVSSKSRNKLSMGSTRISSHPVVLC